MKKLSLNKARKKPKTSLADVWFTKADGDLNSLDWDGKADVNLFNTYLDRCEITQAQADAISKRIEASSKRFPI